MFSAKSLIQIQIPISNKYWGFGYLQLLMISSLNFGVGNTFKKMQQGINVAISVAIYINVKQLLQILLKDMILSDNASQKPRIHHRRNIRATQTLTSWLFPAVQSMPQQLPGGACQTGPPCWARCSPASIYHGSFLALF